MSDMAEKPGKVGFILVGVFEILMGLFCFLLTGFMLLGTVLANKTGGPPASQIIPAASLYLGAGVFFMVFGIGTILAKRWARTLMLIFSWVWLVSGLFGLATMVYLMPYLEKSMTAAGNLPPGTLSAIEIAMAVTFFIFFLLIPGILVLFYIRQKAKAVVEAWNPEESWTDKCPAPVLAVSLLSGLGALFMVLYMPFYRFVMPFFGAFLSGWPGAGICLASTAALAYCAWGFYQVKWSAWWTFLVFILFSGVSCTWTFSTLTMLDMYQAMQMPEVSIEMLKRSGMFDTGSFWGIYMGAIFGVYLVYLLFIRRYFREPR